MPRVTQSRTVNRRGSGSHLREEIVQAAERLLESPEPRAELTLRSIAREAGIAAPSIYPHFPHRDAILDAVVGRAFQELTDLCRAAAQAASSGRAEIVAICHAYLDFARRQPGRYRLLFEREQANIASPPHPYAEGLQAFHLLTSAIDHLERSDSIEETISIAQVLMVGLHGIATLPPSLPGFPWIAEEELLMRLVDSVVTPSSTSQSGGGVTLR